jgi:nitrite reductase/ring-hydroxylating ferredoxin subunit
MLRCAYHNYTFKLANGSGVNCPGFRISVYQIKEEDGGLFAQPVPAS